MDFTFFFYLIFCFSILFSSVMAFSLFYFKYKLKIIKYYIILTFFFIARLIIFVHSYYLDSMVSASIYYKIVNVIMRFLWLSLFVLVLPRFYFYIVEKKITIQVKIVIILFSVMQLIFIAGPFVLYRYPSSIYNALEGIFVYVNNSLFAVLLLFCMLYALLRYNNIKINLTKKIIKINLVLGIVLLPILIVDMLETGDIIDIFPAGFLLIYLFSAVFSIASLILFYNCFLKRIEITIYPETTPESFIITNNITKREKDIIALLLNRYTYKKIANSLFISERTVECHVSNIYRKTNVKSKFELIELIKVFHSLN